MSTVQQPRPTAVIVYESMFGSTRRIAEAVASGMKDRIDVTIVSAADAPPRVSCDVLVIGAPTHAHSLSRPSSRAEAGVWARDHGKRLTLEPGAGATGVREWLEGAPEARLGYAAFDTRVDMPKIFTGAASSAIAKRLTKAGLNRLSPPESYLVDKDSHLLDGELERARAWGDALAAEVLSRRSPVTGEVQ
ncbi:flavodoxin domain-containing protein [Microbacterium sp. LWO12-1.2]|uniref:flavodoxin domain-containing protein n=1 Tax=Microbacterium sp. LWO12-1.2 TaxID=3135261 RepID=UPI00343246E6